jgi:diguanylate cyclase (GGDEF)-like protein
MLALAREKGLHRFEWIHVRADGTEFVAEVTLSLVALREGQVIYCVWRDITERKAIGDALLRQNSVLSAIIENFPGAISVFDRDLRLTAHNKEFRRLMDLPDALFEKPEVRFEDIIRYNVARGEYGPGDPERQFAEIVARARDFTPHNVERVRPNGVALDIRGMPLPGGGFVTIYIDITERKEMEEQVRHLAFYDALTNLPNRRLLTDRLGQTMAASKRSGLYGALMFLDLDNFKPLNDAHGHVVGDLLLIEVASRLRSCIREMDTVARFGGDEFVVMLSELHEDRAVSARQTELVAEKIRLRLAEPYLLAVKREGQAQATVEHVCTVSIGASLFINHEASQDDILKWADAAMYQAKDAGRNQIRFHGQGTPATS